MRLIDADELRKRIDNERSGKTYRDEWDEGWRYGISDAAIIIDTAPTVRRPNVRIRPADPTPATERVPLHLVIGRTLPGETEAVAGFQAWDRPPQWWARGGDDWHDLPLNDDGSVTVLQQEES